MNKKAVVRIVFLVSMCYAWNAFSFNKHSYALENPGNLSSAYGTQINLSDPSKTIPLHIRIEKSQSRACGWQSGQSISVRLYVERKDGTRAYIQDADGVDAWTVQLNAEGESDLWVTAGPQNFSGNLTVLANDRVIAKHSPFVSVAKSCLIEKILERRSVDGVNIQVRYTDQVLEEAGETEAFAKEVLDSALWAYDTITRVKGFGADGYSIAKPDKTYSGDAEKVLIIYLGSADCQYPFANKRLTKDNLKEAPYFDTVRLSDATIQPVIFLPAGYRAFIREWEKINPSKLGERNVHTDLRGTLIHEMLHAVTYYYNRNLDRDAVGPEAASRARELDWYVEGLARYFETFVGARHDFYSQGWRQVLQNKIRFSRGGSNYLMRYPDQSFFKLRYENALFWRYIDHRYGMESIERLSRFLRNRHREDFERLLEEATGTSFEELQKGFSRAIILKNFGLKDEKQYLENVAKTDLLYRHGDFYLVDGYGAERCLGKTVRTDWIGRWGEYRATFDEDPVAGDETEASDIAPLGRDYVQIRFCKNESVPEIISMTVTGKVVRHVTQIALYTEKEIIVEDLDNANRTERSVDVRLGDLLKKYHYEVKAIQKVVLILSNLDSQNSLTYEITAG